MAVRASPDEIAPFPAQRIMFDRSIGLSDKLSDRELELLAYLPSRLTNVEIAHQVYLSPNTVKFHLKNIYRKLEVDSRDWAVARADQLGLFARDVHRCPCGTGWISEPESAPPWNEATNCVPVSGYEGPRRRDHG